MKETQFSKNGVHTEQDCPVCNTQNEATAVHCKTCAWYFPMKDTPQFALELSRAKQQFQMIQSFNQVYQHMQIQSKVLEKMSFRLDGMEADMQKVKDKNFLVINPEVGLDEPTYPELEPIKSVVQFTTFAEKHAWWNNLEEQWKKAFNAALWQKGEITDIPTEEEFTNLFTTPTFRAVGPRGMYGNITFELTNLSGLQQLTNLETLVISHNALTNLVGIEHLSKLSSLFVNANKITDLSAVYYLPQLSKLYCNVNQLATILPVKNLTNLEVLYCNYNQLINFHGITTAHTEKLKEFFCFPNEKVETKEIKRLEEGLNIKCKKG